MKKPGRHKKRVEEHFREQDSLIHGVLSGMEWQLLEPAEKTPGGYFNRLCREIISQQLGSGAARAITARFRALFRNGRATPAGVLRFSEEDLRRVGMSWAKARSVRDLALRIDAREIDFEKFASADDQQVIADLVKVKGIGRWTAEMFLIFTLGRENVFSPGDLALQKGMRHLYGARRGRTEKARDGIIARWHPYRSYACLALWHLMDGDK